MHDYTKIMSEFYDVYIETPTEGIQGWDRILLLAKTMQDEDLTCVYENLVPPELVNKYRQKELNMKQADHEYELQSINNSKDISSTA